MKFQSGTVVRVIMNGRTMYYVVISRKSIVRRMEDENHEHVTTEYVLDLLRQNSDTWRRLAAVHKEPEEFENVAESPSGDVWLPHEDIPDEAPGQIHDIKERIQ